MTSRREAKFTAGPDLGVVEWFRPGERERVEVSIEAMRSLGIRRLRTPVAAAESGVEAGDAWYRWLLPLLSEDLDVLPTFDLGVGRDPDRCIELLELVLGRCGRPFSHVELSCGLQDPSWYLRPDWASLSEAIAKTTGWLRRHGWRIVLSGICPLDSRALAKLAEQGALEGVDAVGLHGYPGDEAHGHSEWRGWRALIVDARAALAQSDLQPELWITETGYSTWRHDEARQVDAFLEATAAPADRVYWRGLWDLGPGSVGLDGRELDERERRFGMFDSMQRPKLLARTLGAGGADAANTLHRLWSGSAPAVIGADRHPVVVTGGAGFLGANLADRLAASGKHVLLVDGLKRVGVEKNLEWLVARHGDRVGVRIADIRDPSLWRGVLPGAEAVFHFAAQVAVTSSLDDPREDFEVNAAGTLNLLEGVRALSNPPPLFFASTNKVYGDLADIEFKLQGEQWVPADHRLGARGIDEARPLDLHSPYGCSKGAADQYVLDYARMFGIRATVLRMSCLYGPRQFGTEDQGWVAHFLISALKGAPISIYGDGKQVRDVLHVDDAVDAYLAAWREIDAVSGRAFNLGGGPENAVSLHQVLAAIERISGRRLSIGYAPTRPGDQVWYVSDTTRFGEATGWRPRRAWTEGLAHLHQWASEFFAPASHTEQADERRLTECALP